MTAQIWVGTTGFPDFFFLNNGQKRVTHCTTETRKTTEDKQRAPDGQESQEKKGKQEGEKHIFPFTSF